MESSMEVECYAPLPRRSDYLPDNILLSPRT
jgi:hypothetical protein